MSVALCLGSTTARGQSSRPVEDASAPGTSSTRPGLFQVGGFYFTPYLRIGTLGIDTNVFYTATERRTDFTATGGPGLDIVRPLGSASRVQVEGGVDYVYFLRAASERRLNAYGSGSIDLVGIKTHLALEGRWGRAFSRPTAEVNARLQQETTAGHAFFRRNLGERFAFSVTGSAERTVTDGVTYQGTDLGATLTQDHYLASGELRMVLSLKTQLVAGGEQSWYLFPHEVTRDGRSTLAYGGLRTDASALIGGQALAGVRWFQLDAGGRRAGLYVSVDATWNVTPKTKLGGHYSRDLAYSSFDTSGATPTNEVEMGEAFLEKILVGGLYLRLFAQGQWLVADGQLKIVGMEATASTLQRQNTLAAGGELGWQFRSRLRVGLRAAYEERAVPISTFGVKGLLAGLTVQYNPPQPSLQ